MKKIASIVLSLLLVLSCVSALADAFVPAESYDIGERNFDGGVVTLEKAGEGGGEVTTDVYAGLEGQDYTDEKVYTFNDFTADINANSGAGRRDAR